MEEEIFSDLKHYFCNDHLFYRWVSDQIIRFVSQKEGKKNLLEYCHSPPYGGHFTSIKIETKVVQLDLY